jgi:cobalt-zinc-cadmium efflux system membrane fusion protein
MKRTWRTQPTLPVAALLAGLGLSSAACQKRVEASRETAPPPVAVIHDDTGGTVKLDHPERFPTATVGRLDTAPTLAVTGLVTPDVSRTVPVLSLVSGRVVEIRAQLGDHVTKGQVLLRLESADASSAVADFRKADVDDVRAKALLARAEDLFGHGAIAKKDLEAAQDEAAKAGVDRTDTEARLRVIGADPHGATPGLLDIIAPVAGVITEQNVTAAGGVRTLDNSPNLFTIADLSQVWIVCDVYENDLASVRDGDTADIRIAAFPNRVLVGRISNIGPILDPSIRTAKVRVEVPNPGILRVGMFATATFKGQQAETHAVVPITAVLHLHDRAWVYVATPDGFRRQEVATGAPVGPDRQQILTGLRPGDRVVANALVFQNTIDQ